MIFLASIYDLIYRNWRIAGVLAVFFLILVVVIAFDRCGQQNALKRENEIKENITTKKVEANFAGNETNRAAETSNQAQTNVNDVRNTNLNTFSNNFDEVRQRYCKEFPQDCK